MSVFGNNTVGPGHVKASTYYVPGLSALAVISGSFVNLVISSTAQRETGVVTFCCLGYALSTAVRPAAATG